MTEAASINKLTETIRDLKRHQEEWLKRLQKVLTADRNFQEIFNLGLKVHHERIGLRNSEQIQWLTRIRADPDLRFPHLKILEYLEKQHDPVQQEFKEVQLSELIRKGKIGKNRANQYVQLLEEKGYIEERTDGYRRLIKLANNPE